MDNCIFCKIAKGGAPAKVLLETDSVICFESIDPVAEKHILIVPKKHIAHFGDISKEDRDILFDMVLSAQKLVSDLGISGGYKLVFNAGKYQAIPHLHWHLLGGKMLDEKDVLNKT